MHNVCIEVILRQVCLTIVAMEKGMFRIFWVCFYSISYPACIIFWSVYCLAVSHFTTLSHKQHIFGKFLNIKYVFWFSLWHWSQTLSFWEDTIITTYIGLLHIKYQLLLSYFNETWIFDRFSRTTDISNCTNMCAVGDELFMRTDGQMWRG
jgi:hypothetical protein